MTEIIAHRGGAILWPENSLQAFRQSIAAGVDAVECDVHLSSDGVPIVMHDATLERTSNGTGPVARWTAAELAEMKLVSADGEPPPRLSDLLSLVADSRVGLQVEVKADAAGRPDLALLERTLVELDRHGMRGRTELITFEAEIATAAVAAGGLLNVAWLFAPVMLRYLGPDGVVTVAHRTGATMVETHEAVLDAELLGVLRGAGLRVGAWGVNRSPAIRRMLELGPDALATDDPILALAMRVSAGS
ncbi:glycerophosphodiester phosphodiesterase [Pararoseomonas indoligenes]|uniref:Glycerophosphodiester phosphodiesterase n=1 Tax=Roseomonas indoligenes TaxID=2820811 RepID=A0A940S774_9PROT|nr:glycerophosphodiester phosphodiesterase family protein [Pararoseomonas indoligenes]MBP0494774.1 glycerophosphodiester phosphodiesterase [Pararoseomonas indoligenes]